jgi:chorismate-pyruvate lyase
LAFVNSAFLEALTGFDIPACLRLCAGTDGSVTFLLEIMTLNEVSVVTEAQYLIEADPETARKLGIGEGAPVNYRVVKLVAGDVPYVHALSLSPLERMPEAVRQDMMKADIPIGKILRTYGLETRRDLESLKYEDDREIFGCTKVLSRTYRIIHHNQILMWIRESFPADSRWSL